MNSEDVKVDKKSKILFSAILAIILISIGATYYKIMVKRDYQILAETNCDPATERCFIRECVSEESEESEESEAKSCGENYHYKYINKNAAKIGICDSGREECPELKCEAGEANCEYIFCEPENLEKGESCVIITTLDNN